VSQCAENAFEKQEVVLTAKSGNTAPKILRMMVFAAIAEAANIKYESMM